MATEQRWLNGLLSQIDFHLRGCARGRRDQNFDWKWFRRLPTAHFIDTRRRIRKLLGRLNGNVPKGYSVEWLVENSSKLWQTRQLLQDDLSRRQFDDAITLKIVGYRRAYFPPEAFDEYLELCASRPFVHEELPNKYMNVPLRELEVSRAGACANIIATDGFLDSINLYRQYFVERAGVDFAPQPGETVIDCGACIGEVATLFALLVGASGQVHMFDPMPVHVAFCNLQKTLNPSLASRMHIVPMAVGAEPPRLSWRLFGLSQTSSATGLSASCR
ncbi:hypothetical protein [Dokdonella sp.]|uniref:hypothetical protein n=1 Tax=Dokdonella sp. TaxID=2291710 RepID=UPI0025BF9FB6|nr:hypothetical protein [Dokdonella sp.]MBX3692104.1 hypothetical protein [Dokdonella sp.]